ncbi:MAG TPA: J domain-containing protein [Vicinamibacterales bacterium]
MKDYYTLLAVEPGATIDDIKRAFRREIARYHPDKVHHLGREFQALAAERAAELTEAYRVLMDASLRASYDQERVAGGGAEAAWRPPEPAPPPAAPPSPGPDRARAETPPAPPPPRAAKPPQPGGEGGFVRRMAIARFRSALEQALDGVTPLPARGFEAGYLVKGKRSLFGKAVPERVLTAYVGTVTGAVVAELGHQALAARGTATALTVFALAESLGPAGEISSAVTALRRRAPAGVTLNVVPLNVRDWTAMMPKDASANARAVIAQLTAKD